MDLMEKDKKGQLEQQMIAVYDNLKLEDASKKGRWRADQGVVMPGFTNNVKKVLS